MMNINKHITAGLIAAACGFVPAAAQSLNKEITIDKDVVPEERAASRLPILPSLVEVKPVDAELQFNYTGIPAHLAPYMSWIAPSVAGGALKVSEWRGYAQAGYFPTYNATLSAGYRVLDTERDRLSVWGHFSGSRWRNPSKDYVERPYFNDSGAALGASYLRNFGNNTTLDVALTLNGDWFNNPFSGALHSNRFNGPLGECGGAYYLEKLTQGVLNGKLDARWSSRQSRVDYSIALHGDIFKMQKSWAQQDGIIDPASEQAFTIDGDMVVAFDAESTSPSSFLTFDYGATLVHRNASLRPDGGLSFYEEKGGNASGLVTLTPGIKFAGANYQVNIGARVDLSFNMGGTFHIAPKIEAVGAPSRYFKLFAVVKGGQHLNTASSLYSDLRYFNPATSYQSSQVALDADGGFAIGPWRGFQINVHGGYAIANDWVMPGVATGTLLPIDMKGWRFGGGMRYDWRNIVGVAGNLTLAQQGYDKGFYMWRDRASMVLDGTLTVRPIEALTIDVTGEAHLKRRFYTSADSYTFLGALADLSVGADYKFTPQFSVFAKGTNLLNRYWGETAGPGVPCHGRTGLVGVTYLF